MAMSNTALEGASWSTTQALTRLLDSGAGPMKMALLTRALNGLAEALPHLEEKTAADVVGEASNYAVLRRILEQPEVVEALRQHDPLEPARLRWLRAREELLTAEGGVVRAGAAARLLGITRQALDKRRRAGRLIALTLGRRQYGYPLWQFASGGMLRGLDEVLIDLHELDPWTQVAFLLGGNYRLPNAERPLDALRHGDTPAVRGAARAYAEHGAA